MMTNIEHRITSCSFFSSFFLRQTDTASCQGYLRRDKDIDLLLLLFKERASERTISQSTAEDEKEHKEVSELDLPQRERELLLS